MLIAEEKENNQTTKKYNFYARCIAYIHPNDCITHSRALIFCRTTNVNQEVDSSILSLSSYVLCSNGTINNNNNNKKLVTETHTLQHAEKTEIV